MILIVDNYDSFVFNLWRYVRELGMDSEVVRNDQIRVDEIEEHSVQGLIISPGPCGPAQAGASLGLIKRWSGTLPILGVCLGHQCIGEAFGARIGKAREPLHGEASNIHHDASGVLKGIPNGFKAGRYHALIVQPFSEGEIPLRVTARSTSDEIMGLRHARHPTFGVQFHPESILTDHGLLLMNNFLDYCR